MDKNSTVRLFGLDFFGGSQKDFVQIVRDQIEQPFKKITIVFTPNPEQIVLTQQDSTFFKNLQQADFLIPDGGGMVNASRVFAFFGKGDTLTERVAGVDVVAALLPTLEGRNALIIGGREYTESVFLSHVGGVARLRWTAGYKDVHRPTSTEEKNVRKFIEDCKPEVVFVAFGAPYQEKWVIDHKEFLENNHVKVAMVVGGAFDFLFGKVRRAPKFIQAIGFEWLFRLLQEPWRWRRQLKLIEFMWLGLLEVAKGNFRE